MATWTEKESAIRALERNGRIDPIDLIEAAKSQDHPCHEDFTWDVNKAALERWRDQARELIRRIHFEVHVDQVTERVVTYVANEGDEHQFQSLPKIRSKVTAGSVLAVEVAMLLGLSSRVYGIALAKQGLVGVEAVTTLRMVRDTLSELNSQFQEK
jgi:hypothetical protein